MPIFVCIRSMDLIVPYARSFGLKYRIQCFKVLTFHFIHSLLWCFWCLSSYLSCCLVFNNIIVERRFRFKPINSMNLYLFNIRLMLLLLLITMVILHNNCAMVPLHIYEHQIGFYLKGTNLCAIVATSIQQNTFRIVQSSVQTVQIKVSRILNYLIENSCFKSQKLNKKTNNKDIRKMWLN